MIINFYNLKGMSSEIQDGQQSLAERVQKAYDSMGRGANFNRIMKGVFLLKYFI